LGLSQTILLAELYSHDGCRQDDLRLAINLDKGTITRAIQGLEEQGFVTRTTDTADRRAVRVHITDKARNLEPKMVELALAWDNTLTGDLTQEERAMLAALLMRVETNLKNMNTATVPRVNLHSE
jgi:DNA-binding MarR family transcriptional regulator